MATVKSDIVGEDAKMATLGDSMTIREIQWKAILGDNDREEKVIINEKYGYCKNHKKTVKAGQTRTRDGKECTRAEDLIARK
ncbi:hypothetical protein Tco_1168151, partial [Tanacetum coccineum]